jgi:hypothetical protein
VTPWAVRLLRDLDGRGVEIDADDRTLGANQGGHKETNVTDAATNIKHMHAAANPSHL